MDFAKRNNGRRIKLAAGTLAAGLLVLVAPPFHVRRVDGAAMQRPAAPAGLDAVTVAQRLWEQEIPAASARAVDVNALVAAFTADPNEAERLGRRPGLGGKFYYFVRGEGRVSGIERAGVLVDTGSPATRVLLKTGPVFGNALRDAPGLFDLQTHSSFDSNAVSTELNRLAETRAQAALLERASVGARLRFTACGEAEEKDGSIHINLIAVTVDNAS